MTTIGFLSDTHNLYDDHLREFFASCDILIHGGDIGSLELADRIASEKKLVAVCGNIDDHKTRAVYPMMKEVMVEGVKILITHIGGYPGCYNKDLHTKILRSHPKIVVCGHSHILKVVYDQKLEHLHINPGAAGIHGFHKVRSAIRMKIDGERMFDMEVGNWERKAPEEK